MLTMDDLYAVMLALDLGHVERLILVGDPNQLPPIGVGRPFADLVGVLDEPTNDAERDAADALARLTVEVRTALGAPSDALRLAAWFTNEPQPKDADRVLSDLELGATFNDLEIRDLAHAGGASPSDNRAAASSSSAWPRPTTWPASTRRSDSPRTGSCRLTTTTGPSASNSSRQYGCTRTASTT